MKQRGFIREMGKVGFHTGNGYEIGTERDKTDGIKTVILCYTLLYSVILCYIPADKYILWETCTRIQTDGNQLTGIQMEMLTERIDVSDGMEMVRDAIGLKRDISGRRGC